jgi:hypothetical protein
MNNINDLIRTIENDELFCIDNKVKMIKIKMLKYSKEEILNKIKIIFKDFEDNLFINKYINYYNYISYHFLNYFMSDEEKQENNEIYLEELIKLIKPKININKLEEEILSFNNIKLLLIISTKEYLINNLLKKNNYNIHSKIFHVLSIIFQNNDLSTLKDVFIILNNIKNEIESLIEQITRLNLKYEENQNCIYFIEYYIQKIIELISDEVTYYINPGLMKVYFDKINNQFLKGKMNYVLMKYLYSKMIELIVDKSIQNNENDKNENGKKYYESAYIYIRENMENFLINRKIIIEDIINKKRKINPKSTFEFLKWID